MVYRVEDGTPPLDPGWNTLLGLLDKESALTIAADLIVNHDSEVDLIQENGRFRVRYRRLGGPRSQRIPTTSA